MRLLIFTCFMFVYFFAKTQNEEFQRKYSEKELNQVDRAELYNRLLKARRINDSINEFLRTDSLLNLYNRVSKDTTNAYSSWYLAMGPSFGDFKGLNNELRNSGLPTFNETAFGFTYIISFAFTKNRYFHDIALGFTMGGKNKKDSLSLRYNTVDLINYKFGYEIIKSKRLSFIPYVGIDLQVSNLIFDNEAKSIPDPNISNYPDLFYTSLYTNSGTGTEFSKTELIGNFGLEIDYHLKYRKFENGVILGLRGGGMTPLIDSDWKLNGEKYKSLPEVNLKQSYFQLVLKFYWRNLRHPINPYSNPIFE